jgi:hypothetical protein
LQITGIRVCRLTPIAALKILEHNVDGFQRKTTKLLLRNKQGSSCFGHGQDSCGLLLPRDLSRAGTALLLDAPTRVALRTLFINRGLPARIPVGLRLPDA